MIWLSTLLLILSKIPDLHSTWIHITSANQERNRIVRGIMKYTGPKGGLLLVMVIYIVFVAVCHLICMFSENFWWNINYLIGAVIFAVANLAVAVQNYTRRSNFITRFIVRLTGTFYK